MISKSQISLINSLKIKKYRVAEKLFVAEGDKIVKEILVAQVQIKYIIALPEWIEINKLFLNNFKSQIIEVNEYEMKKLSSLTTPSPVIVVAQQFPPEEINYTKNDIYLALDDIRDPGNLGTIIRICDWYGIENIICSETCTDLYSPKTIQACMGSFLRVNLHYNNLETAIINYKRSTNNLVYGTFLKGENIYKSNLENGALIVLGNESKGINSNTEKLIDIKLLIPSYSKNKVHSESLNVSIATAICCSEFFRRK